MSELNNITKRNGEVVKILESAIKSHQKGVSTKEQDGLLSKVFSTTAWGYREIILVIVMGRIINDNYKASKAFYACNPRALYEGPIRMVLAKHKIPHRKSGPLNIAKATIGINSQWAAQRRPLDVAKATVELVKNIDGYSKKELENFLKILSSRFLSESGRVRDMVSPSDPNTDPRFLFNLCEHIVVNAPDSGNTAQRISGLLLEQEHKSDNIKVWGHEDRASVTSTTSKKPGDIIEERPDGTIRAVYEITTKPFNASRMTESWETVMDFISSTGKTIKEVLVICRPSDAQEILGLSAPGSYMIGEIEYEGINYVFINIFDWIKSQIIRLDLSGRLDFFSQLEAYVIEPNTAEKVKIAWKEYLSKISGVK